MAAIRCAVFDPEAPAGVRMATKPRPACGRGTVLVRVHAAGVRGGLRQTDPPNERKRVDGQKRKKKDRKKEARRTPR